MRIVDTRLPEVKIVEAKVFSDDRGYFFELFKQDTFIKENLPTEFVQDNVSRSSKNVLRGLHYQLDPLAQGKFIRVLTGKVFDVAVDIRRSSANFGKWIGVRLSEDNQKALYIPPGFAHGFLSLEDDTRFIYKCTKPYSPQHERSIFWNDPAIGIDWPVSDPSLSAKDAIAPRLVEAEIY